MSNPVGRMLYIMTKKENIKFLVNAINYILKYLEYRIGTEKKYNEQDEEKGWFSNEDGWKDFGKKQTYIYGCFRKWNYICPFLLGKFPQYSMVCDLPK